MIGCDPSFLQRFHRFLSLIFTCNRFSATIALSLSRRKREKGNESICAFHNAPLFKNPLLFDPFFNGMNSSIAIRVCIPDASIGKSCPFASVALSITDHSSSSILLICICTVYIRLDSLSILNEIKILRKFYSDASRKNLPRVSIGLTRVDNSERHPLRYGIGSE